MEVKITYLDQVRFNVQARSHTVVCDQPAENGGEDAGMTPPEFLLASLGSCAAFYAVQFLKTRNLPYHGVEVSITAEKLKSPARLGEFRIFVQHAAQLTDEQTEGLMRAVRHCLVHNTLLAPPSIHIELAAAQPLLAPR